MGFEDIVHRAQDRAIPISVTLELTDRCNFTCKHCFIPDHQIRDGVTTERWLSLLDELAESGTLFLTLSGGEVLCRGQWLKVATRARELGFVVRVFTNASLIDEAIACAFADLCMAAEVSLYSMDAEVFEGIAGAPGCHAKTLHGIELLRARGVEVKIKAPAMKHNLHGIAAVYEYADRIGADFHTDARLVGRRDGDQAPTRLRAAPEDLQGYYRAEHSVYQRPDDRDAGSGKGQTLCAAGARVANVTAKGDVLPCALIPVAVGNINERGFSEIWEHAPKLEQLRHMRRSDLVVCDTCADYNLCERCPGQALTEDGDIRGPASWSCGHVQVLMKAFDEES